MKFDRRYLEFLYYFNETRDYFECHEVLEELWLEEGRNLLYQGLLQAAVGLYHHENGNKGGAVKLFTQAVEKLRQYPTHTLGIDLGQFLRNSETYLERLLGDDGRSFPFSPFPITILDPGLNEELEKLKASPPVPGEEE